MVMAMAMLRIAVLGIASLGGIAEAAVANRHAAIGERSPTSACAQDNCYRAYIHSTSIASEFCSVYIQSTKTATASTPGMTNVITTSKPQSTNAQLSSRCNLDAASDGSTKTILSLRLSSACTCISVIPLTVTTIVATSTMTATTSTIASSTTTKSSSTSTTTSTPSQSASLTSPACQPTFALSGASDTSFNAPSTKFSVVLSCASLDVTNYTVFANWVVVKTTATPTAITIDGFAQGNVLLAIIGLTTTGLELFQTFQLLFGAFSMPVTVLGMDGKPAIGVFVQANATQFTGVSQSGYTDNNGLITFHNLIAATIGLEAFGPDGQIGFNGLATTASPVTLQLKGLQEASNSTNYDFSDGTIQPWTKGSLIPHVENHQTTKRQDLDLEISTGGQYDLQSTSATFKVYGFTTQAYIRYLFQTQEVPGGYFGTQFNDYFSLSIQDDAGHYASITNSMNALGIGAFDANGYTSWYTLVLPVSKASKIQYSVGVSNVADNLYDSAVIVDKVGDLDCDDCSDCSKCPGNPMCQPTCTNPPAKSCDFYTSCMEATVPCGASGYALSYGDKNCHKFLNNLNSFSATGQAWIYGTLHCLQLALVPAVTCDATCGSLQSAAFDSHPKCYVDNGFCNLEASDYLHVLGTVGTDLVSLEALKEIALTGSGCVQNAVKTISAKIDSLVADAANGLLDAVEAFSEEQALKIVRKFLEGLNPGFTI